MVMQELDQSYNTMTNATTTTSGISSSALQLRLETNKILEDIELFLRGAKIIVEEDEGGNIHTKRVNIGKAKANDFGIQAILSQVSMVINPQVVQGNFASESEGYCKQFEEYIIRLQINLACNIMDNLHNWEILEEDYNVIIDNIMDLIEPYMTRLIDNKERESYNNTIRHLEHSTVGENKSGIFGLFSKK